MALPVIAALAPSILKGLYGLFGMNEFGDKPRPEYKIPKGIGDAESMYSYIAGSDIAGQKEATTNIQQSQANVLDNLTQNVDSGAALLNTAPKIQAGTNNALTELAVQSGQQKQANQKTLADFLQGTKAQYEDKKWQINEFDPYVNDQKAAERATQNLFSGITELGSGILNINEANKTDELTKSLGVSPQVNSKSLIEKVASTVQNLGVQAGLKSIAPANVDLYSVLNGYITAKSETPEQIMMKDAQGIDIQSLIKLLQLG